MMTHNSKGITDDQIIEAVQQYGGFNGAAKHLGCDRKNVSKRYKRLRPDNDLNIRVTEGFTVKGISDYTKTEEGARWTKYDIDKVAQVEALEQFAESLKQTIKPVKPIKPPKQKPQHLLNQYTITDFHLGMLATESESGTDWNIEKAEELLVNWFNLAISQALDSHTAILANLGDFFQWEGMTAKTPAHGHILDASTRHGVLTDTFIRSIRKIITLLLQKHNHVHIIMCPGNHDPSSPNIHSKWINVLYENEPRVTVDTSDSLYFAYEFGKCSLFYHHGHKRNINNVAESWISRFREMYGRTKYSYGNTGHLHHNKVIRDTGIKVEQHPTLVPHDAHSAGGGYDEERLAKVLCFHRDFGKCGTIELTPEMVENLT
jgi:hypothetical protein